jgi:hypothetical protein
MTPLPYSSPHVQAATASRTGSVKTPARDLEWNRPIFRAPMLSNPHVVFDPLPFRSREPVAKGR